MISAIRMQPFRSGHGAIGERRTIGVAGRGEHELVCHMPNLLSANCLVIAFFGGLSLVAKADAPVLWGVAGGRGVESRLYAIDPDTGKSTEVGSTGLESVSGLAVHPTTKVLYATQREPAAGKALATLDKIRGSAATIGDLGEAISDSAFSPEGVLYVFGDSSRDLLTVNRVTASTTLIKADAALTGGCGLAFDESGDLFITRGNSIAKLNPATGNVVSSALISGEATDVDNLLATRGDGVIFAGRRTGNAAPTRLMRMDPATGVTALVCSVPLALEGMAFDVAPTPGFKVSGLKIKRTKRDSLVLRGVYTSTVPATITANLASTTAKSGPWKLRVTGLKRGTNRIRLWCEDAVGQKGSVTVRVVVEG